MAQIIKRNTLALLTSGTAGIIILVLAACFLVAIFSGLSQGQAYSSKLLRETLPSGHLCQDNLPSLSFAIAAIPTTASRLPATYSHQGGNTPIYDRLPANTALPNITPSTTVGEAIITPTTANLYTSLFIDLSPPHTCG